MVAGESVGDAMIVDVAMGFRIWKAEGREEHDKPGTKILCAVGKEFLGRVVSDSNEAGCVMSEQTTNEAAIKAAPHQKEVSSADSLCHTVTPVGEEKQEIVVSPGHLPSCPSLIDDKLAVKILSGPGDCEGPTEENRRKSASCECRSLVSVVEDADCVSDVDVGSGGDDDARSAGKWMEAWAIAQRGALAKVKHRGNKSRVGFVGVPDENDKMEGEGKGDGSQGSGESQADGCLSNSNTDHSDTCARARPSERGGATIAGARRRRRGSGLWSSDETEEGASCGPNDRDWAKKRRMTEASASSPDAITTLRVVVPGMTADEVVERARLQMASPGFPLKIRVRVEGAGDRPAGLSVDVDMADVPETPIRAKPKAPQTPRSAVTGKKSHCRLDLASPPPPTPGSVSRRHSSCGSAAEMMPSPRPASTPSRRNSTSYGINDFCGLAQAKRIEILKCKDIFCPQWRVLEEGAAPTTGCAEVAVDGEESSDEEDDDAAYERRHAALEVNEKLITLPVVQKRRAAHAPHMQEMPAVSEVPTPKMLSRRNSMTSLKQGGTDKASHGTSSTPASRRPSLSGPEFLRELNGIQIMDHKTGLPTDAFTLASAPGRRARSTGAAVREN